jgi:hypothetical protein
MADHAGLKFVGFIFATVTLAVMIATVQVVKSHADGRYSLETSDSATADSAAADSPTADVPPADTTASISR